MIAGIFYGTSFRARRPFSVAVDPIFCAQTDEGAVYYGLLAKFIAYYFNGENGNNRVADL